MSIWVLILSNLLVFQLSGFYRFEKSKSFLNDDEIEKIQEGEPISATDGTEILNPLVIPRGTAVALPSIRVDSSEEVERGIYGGEGDKGHLGGFTKDKIDMDGVSVGKICEEWKCNHRNRKHLILVSLAYEQVCGSTWLPILG